MPGTESHYTPEELARLGSEVFDRQVRPVLRLEDEDKFVAIDVESGDHEIDEDDYAVVTRPAGPLPVSRGLARSGRPASGIPDEARPMIRGVVNARCEAVVRLP